MCVLLLSEMKQSDQSVVSGLSSSGAHHAATQEVNYGVRGPANNCFHYYHILTDAIKENNLQQPNNSGRSNTLIQYSLHKGLCLGIS